MKIALYSDLHLYNHHRLLVNSETALKFLTHLKDYCINNKIDTIINAGDFFHTKAKAYAPHVIQALLRVKDINKAGIKQYMLVGNHDMSNPNNTMNSILFTFSDYVKIIPDYHFIDYDSVRIHFLSFTNSMFENFIISEEKKNILIAHLDVIGFTMANGFRATSGFTLEDFKDFDLVISGHYHNHQTRGNLTYIGSPYQTNFAEREQDHGFIVLETDSLEWKFVKNKHAPEYKVLTVKKLSDIKDEDVMGNFIKIKLFSNKISKSKLRDTLFDKGATSVNIIPPEDVKEIKKYYDRTFGETPIEVALAYIKGLKGLDLNRDRLLEYFEKIEDVSANISEYEVDEV